MSLRISSDQKPGPALQAVLESLAREARRNVEKIAHAPERRIHNLRTGMKKYRSLLRLVDRGLKSRTRHALRKSIGTLKEGWADSRDKAVIFHTVQNFFGEKSISRLGGKTPCSEKPPDVPMTISSAADELVTRSETLDLRGFDAEKLRAQWRRSLRAMKRAKQKAKTSGDAHAFHRWRKRAKDLWYQSAALRELGKSIAAAVTPAKKLSDLLGREHDLTMVMDTILDFDGEEKAALVAARKKLRRQAFRAAKEL